MADDLYKTIELALRVASFFFDHSRIFYMKVFRAKGVQVSGVNVKMREGLLKDRAMLPCLNST
jgi:hypothetical protein